MKRPMVRFVSPGHTYAFCDCGWAGPVRDDSDKRSAHQDAADHAKEHKR